MGGGGGKNIRGEKKIGLEGEKETQMPHYVNFVPFFPHLDGMGLPGMGEGCQGLFALWTKFVS